MEIARTPLTDLFVCQLLRFLRKPYQVRILVNKGTSESFKKIRVSLSGIYRLEFHKRKKVRL